MNEEYGFWKDFVLRGVGRDLGFLKSRRKDIRYEIVMWRCVVDDYVNYLLF